MHKFLKILFKISFIIVNCFIKFNCIRESSTYCISQFPWWEKRGRGSWFVHKTVEVCHLGSTLLKYLQHGSESFETVGVMLRTDVCVGHGNLKTAVGGLPRIC